MKNNFKISILTISLLITFSSILFIRHAQGSDTLFTSERSDDHNAFNFIPVDEESNFNASFPNIACVTEDLICIHDPKNTRIQVYDYQGDFLKSLNYDLPEGYIAFEAKVLNDKFDFILFSFKKVDMKLLSRYFITDDYNPSSKQCPFTEQSVSEEKCFQLYRDNIHIYKLVSQSLTQTNLEKEIVDTETNEVFYDIFEDFGKINIDDSYLVVGNWRYKLNEDNILGNGEEHKSTSSSCINIKEKSVCYKGLDIETDIHSSFLGKNRIDLGRIVAIDKYDLWEDLTNSSKEKNNINAIINYIYDFDNKMIYTIETDQNIKTWNIKKYDLETIVSEPIKPTFSDVLPDPMLWRHPESDLLPEETLFFLVENAVKQGWISGYSDSSFKPEKSVNRAEFAKMLMIAFKKSSADEEDEVSILPENLKKYPDVKATWYAPFLSKSVELGVMKGYGDKTMKPNNTIVQAEAIKMALKILDNQEFSEDHDPWYKEYYEYADDNLDLSFLNEGSLKEEMTRGDSVELISEVLKMD